MKKMATSNVLIVGLGGLGVEIAKNVVLAGVRSVTLFDPEPATLADLSTQYYLNEKCLGKRRDEASRPQLAELNEYVPVSVLGQLTSVSQLASDQPTLARFQVIVVTGQPLSLQLQINDQTRSISSANPNTQCTFIEADVRGLAGQVFCDLGQSFTVFDATGEAPIVGLVGGITQESEGIVTCVEETRHGLEDGDYVAFREIKGMTELNGCEPRQISVKGPYTFSIGDTSGLSLYETGGVFEQVKQPKKLSFRPLREALTQPRFVTSDFGKFDRQEVLHAAFLGFHSFWEQHQRLPRPHEEEDAALLIELVKSHKNATYDATDEEKKAILRDFAFTCSGQLPPMTAFMGGLVAQEVLKACSGKFNPIEQFYYFDAFECLPRGGEASNEDYDRLPASEFAPRNNDRYNGQIAVFGHQFQDKILGNLRGFVVGAGAIGCELLKLFAMMGVGTGPRGSLNVTDMDTIEKSNLNRQFLFRSRDVGQPKSQTAAAAVCRLNPLLVGHIEARLDRVGPETENIFDDVFFESLDFVANALDNMEARKYMDRRCVFYRKPLLESGTLGTKGNTQVVIPHLTESYSSSQDPPERTIPFCTLHNFPNAIEHTIQWAMDAFHGMFRSDAEAANLFLTDPAEFRESLLTEAGNKSAGSLVSSREKLERVLRTLILERPQSLDDCISWARLKFEEFFANNIKQLLYNFPRDSKTSSGASFWSGPKRAPNPLVFDPNDPTHMDFIVAAANMRAENYGLKGSDDINHIKQVLTKVVIPEFRPREGVKIQVSENEQASTNNGRSEQGEESPAIEELIHALPEAHDFIGFRMQPIEFEKDDDSNWHVTFVAATANLRAINYEITPATRHSIKQIAGKIIPAIATTTAVVAGLVGLELYKLVSGPQKLDRFKNGFVNLALPFTAFSEPITAPRNRYGETTWTLWDRFEIEGDLLLKDLLDYFSREHGINITMLSYGSSMLYGFIRSKEVLAERMRMPISQLVESVSRKPLPPHLTSLVLEMLAEDKEGEDIEVPYILIKVRKSVPSPRGSPMVQEN